MKIRNQRIKLSEPDYKMKNAIALNSCGNERDTVDIIRQYNTVAATILKNPMNTY